MRNSVLVPVFLALVSACASTEESPKIDPADGEAARAGFERIKALVGDWAGPGGEGAEMSVVEVRYRMTAAGTVVEETIMPGTAHEMVTMYHLDNDRLMLTHYCAAGNQPTMIGVPVGSMTGNVATIRFEFSHATNMPSPLAGHMHQAEMTFEGKDHLVTKWTYWEDGKAGHQANFQLTRKTGA
jgi:hypothetical protein